MVRSWLVVGSLLAGLAVAAGAFGAHGLKTRLPADMLLVFETAVRYQMYHALGLLAVAFASDRWPGGSVQGAGWLMLAGSYSVFREPLRTLLDRSPRPGSHYAAWRTVFPGRLGTIGVERLECEGLSTLVWTSQSHERLSGPPKTVFPANCQ